MGPSGGTRWGVHRELRARPWDLEDDTSSAAYVLTRTYHFPFMVTDFDEPHPPPRKRIMSQFGAPGSYSSSRRRDEWRAGDTSSR